MMEIVNHVLEATWPVLVFLGMAYCAQGFQDEDISWNDVNEKNQKKEKK